MWAVIHFFKDNSVEVVPNNWFNSKCGVCAWPKVNNNNHAKKYVRKRVVPNEREFMFLPARCFNGCNNIESLLEARNKLKKAEDVSDFSDIEKTNQRKKANVPLSPENESDEIGIGCPTISNVIDKSINSEKVMGTPLSTNCHYIENVDEQMMSPDIFSNNALCLTPVCLTSTRSSKVNQKNSPIKKIKSQALFKKKVHSKDLNGDILKTIMRNQLIFKFKLRTIEEKQDIIIKMLEDQASKHILPNGDNSIDYNPMADLFPIECLDDLNKIEDQILLDSEYCKKMVRDLSNNTGGKNVGSSVKKMMLQLFDDKLLQKFSFAGRKLTSKKCFQSLGFYKIINEATKKMSKFKGIVRQEEIDDAIKYMLIQAPFRLKRKLENAAIV